MAKQGLDHNHPQAPRPSPRCRERGSIRPVGSQAQFIPSVLSSHNAGFKGSQWLLRVGGRKPCTLATMCMFFNTAPGSAEREAGREGGREEGMEGGNEGGRQTRRHCSSCRTHRASISARCCPPLDNYFVKRSQIKPTFSTTFSIPDSDGAVVHA